MPEPVEIWPDDIHNRVLTSHVHPADWINPEPAGRYNLVVLGGGIAGLVTAATRRAGSARGTGREAPNRGRFSKLRLCAVQGPDGSRRAVADVRDAAQFVSRCRRGPRSASRQ